MRVDSIDRQGLKVIVRSGERTLLYLANEHVGVTR
jgi:hypothetical protein